MTRSILALYIFVICLVPVTIASGACALVYSCAYAYKCPPAVQAVVYALGDRVIG